MHLVKCLVILFDVLMALYMVCYTKINSKRMDKAIMMVFGFMIVLYVANAMLIWR